MINSIYLFYNGLKNFIQIVLMSLIGSHLVMAKSTEQPVISAAHSYSFPHQCDKAYLIQIFENGDVKYLGVHGVKVFGKHKIKISKEAVTKLLKDMNDAGLTVEYKNKIKQSMMLNSSTMISTQAIRIHQNGQEVTFFNADDKFMNEIDKVSKSERWIGKTKECDTIIPSALRMYLFNWFKINR